MGKRDRRGGRAGLPNPSGCGVSSITRRLWSTRRFLFIVRATNVRLVAEVLGLRAGITRSGIRCGELDGQVRIYDPCAGFEHRLSAGRANAEGCARALKFEGLRSRFDGDREHGKDGVVPAKVGDEDAVVVRLAPDQMRVAGAASAIFTRLMMRRKSRLVGLTSATDVAQASLKVG